MASLIITRNGDVQKATDEALAHIPELGSHVRHHSVAIKPNDTWASYSDATAVTQPDTLRAVIRSFKKMSPKEIIVTGGSGAGDTTHILTLAGLMDVIEEEKVSFFDHNKAPFIEAELEYGSDTEVTGPQRKVMVHPRVLESNIENIDFPALSLEAAMQIFSESAHGKRISLEPP